MNTKIAPSSLVHVLTQLRVHHKHTRKTALSAGIFTILNLCAALAFVLLVPSAINLPSLFISWWMLRRYYAACRREQSLLECINHVQRMYVETPERARDHLHQFSVLMHKLGL